MTRVLTCLRCGHEGPDVAAKTVDLEAEARLEGGKVRIVEVELVRELRHVKETTRVVVPERYGTEWRCRDRVACEERYDALMREQSPGRPAAARRTCHGCEQG